MTKTAQAITAKQFGELLKKNASDEERKKTERYFKIGKGEYGDGDKFIGVRMGKLFTMSKDFITMPVNEIEKLLESPIHEFRAGAVHIMNLQARSNKIPDSLRKDLYNLYIRRHDRINNWDLVDLGAIYVVGRYLFDKPRTVLYKLARSKSFWERRSAIVATAYFIKQKEVSDTFKIAELLVNDPHDMVQKAVGGWVRHAGKTNKQELLKFLDKYAATMPRTMLRYAIEHLDAKQKKHYMTK